MAIYVDDEELVAAHQAGDTEAFEELVREYRPSLLAHGRRKLFCDDAAEDAVQETLVRAYRALPKFNGEYRLGPWLNRIMSNVCIDEINRRRRDGAKVEKISAQPLSEFDVPTVEEELGLYSDGAAITEALNELPDSYSEALKLRFVHELGYEQVAEIAGVSEQNARARVSRARVVMRAALKGVAALPILLFGVLRRGEKAAAAATSSAGAAVTSATTTTSSVASQVVPSAMPALTEAAVSIGQVAPTAVPVIAKAAVGIGLAAAVLTPTSDSAVHQTVREIANGPAGVVVQEDNFELNAEGDESFEIAQAAASNPSVAAIVEANEIVVEANETEAADTMVAGVKGTQSVQVSAVDVSAGSLAIKNLVVLPGSAQRSELAGDIAVGSETSRFLGSLVGNSELRLESELGPLGRQRFDALLIVESEIQEISEVRIAGYALEVDGVYQVSGLMRFSGSISETLTATRFEGQMVVAGEGSSLELQLYS
ncbi:MAG: hypothetical protein CL458_04365 [Acidimicrobiaceae bacterium]|nr:hypothetical protein [Acidimicrobiaceae bacterium]